MNQVAWVARVWNRCGAVVAAAVSVAVVSFGCSADSTASEPDRRLLVERTTRQDEPASLSAPWWQTAVEASPATRFVLDGVPAVPPELFAVGEVTDVAGLSGYREPTGGPYNPPTGPNLVEFGSADSFVDLVGVTLTVTDGIAAAGSSLPAQVTFVLGLPAPTDVESLRDELAAYGTLGVLAYRSPAFNSEVGPAAGLELYEVLDGFYLGPIADGTFELGTLLPADQFHKAETVGVSDMLMGAGTINLTSSNGEPVRIDG